MADEKKINIQKIYLKDASLESPQSPQIFSTQSQGEQPKVDVKFNIGHNTISDELSEITLTLTVNATRGEETLYIVEVIQGGIFSIVGFEPQEKHHITGAYAPEVVFPYAREAVDSLLIKSGFPPLAIGPVNFEQFYRQNLQQQIEAAKQKKEAEEAAAAPTSDEETRH